MRMGGGCGKEGGERWDMRIPGGSFTNCSQITLITSTKTCTGKFKAAATCVCEGAALVHPFILTSVVLSRKKNKKVSANSAPFD